MAIKKKFYFPINRLADFEFDRAITVTRTRSKTQAIARSYLVEHLSLDVITSHFEVTRQNVFRAVHAILKDYEVAIKTFSDIKLVYKRLKIKADIHKIAYPFIFKDITFKQLSEEFKIKEAKVLQTIKYVIKRYKQFIVKDLIAEREERFKLYLPFARAREKSIAIAYEHLVLNEPIAEVAKKFKVTNQNASNIIRRFKAAEQRYNEHIEKKDKE